MAKEATCPTCHGKGSTTSMPVCPTCAGSGKIPA